MSPTADPFRRPFPGLRAIVVIFAVAVAAYVRSASTFFLKDDLAMSLLTDAHGVPEFARFSANFLWPVGLAHDQFFRPLPMLTAWFDLNMFGIDPVGFHVCNIAFHALNAVLVGLLTNRLSGWRRPAIGWFAGLLFALHPLHGEAVLWLTQRMVLICCTASLFFLLGLHAWLARRTAGRLAVTVIAGFTAALSKEVAIGLPLAALALAWTHPAIVAAPDGRRRVVRVTAAALLIPVVVFAFRFILFGTLSGTYAGRSALQYAHDFRVFERMPESLLNGFWAVNPLECPEHVRLALGIPALVFTMVGLVPLVRRVGQPEVRATLVTLSALAVGSFLPTIFIFYIEPTLTNGRFLYQPLAALIPVVALGAMPRTGAAPGPRPWALVGLVLIFAVAGQINQRAFDGASSQITTFATAMREAHAARAGDSAFVVYDVPTEYHGVATLDLSLSLLAAPPFTTPGIAVFPVIQGHDAGFDPALRAAFRTWRTANAARPLIHLMGKDHPPSLSPLCGEVEPAEGASACQLLLPAEGELLFTEDAEPVFRFVAPAGVVGVRIHLESGGVRQVIVPDPKRHVVFEGTTATWKPSQGDASGTPDIWLGLRGASFHSPLCVTWRVESLNAAGATIGLSTSQRFVVIKALDR